MPPISLMIKPVSGLCNMRCSYCFYADEMSRRDTPVYERMSDETLENVVRRAFMYADDVVALSFQGGEPTLAGAGFFRQVLRLERKYNTRGLRVVHALQSNGLHMDDEMLDVLREGRFLVGISLDGTQEIHDSRRVDAAGQGTYARVVETIRRLREAKVEYNVLCVVDQRIARQPEKVYAALSQHGFIQYIPCLDALDGTSFDVGLNAEDFGDFLVRTYRLYERSIREGRYVSIRAFDNWMGMLMGHPPENCGLCGYCLPNYLVESNGDVFPCDFYALDEWKLGNLNTASMARIAKSPVMQRFLAASRAIDGHCRECAYLFICRGGCRRDREPCAQDGTPRLNRLCEGYKRFFGLCLEDMQRLAEQIGRSRARDRRARL